MFVERSVVLGLLALGVVVLVWRSSMGAQERAREAGRRACRHADVQFLDDSVARQTLRLRRRPGGLPDLERTYLFEFSTRGDRRYKGSITVVGRGPARVEMEPFEPVS
ncbi:MAG: DUF3301 domain-containing protein [Aquisalimonadaceae bacterium]